MDFARGHQALLGGHTGTEKKEMPVQNDVFAICVPPDKGQGALPRPCSPGVQMVELQGRVSGF